MYMESIENHLQYAHNYTCTTSIAAVSCRCASNRGTLYDFNDGSQTHGVASAAAVVAGIHTHTHTPSYDPPPSSPYITRVNSPILANLSMEKLHNA